MVTSSTTSPAGAPSRTDPTRNIGFLLKDVWRLWERHFRQRAAQLSVTLDQCRVLVHLSRNEGATQARLAELSDTDPMTIVRILDRMEKDGWLERRADPADRRVYRLFLKPAADPVLAEVMRIAEKSRAEALAGLSADERVQLLGLLERIRDKLTSLVPPSAEAVRSPAGPAPRERAQRPRRGAATPARRGRARA